MRSILAALAVQTTLATTDVIAVELQPVLEGLDSPLYVTEPPDGSGRLFVVERPGRIKVLQPGGVTPTVFLDITGRVLENHEQGLLGLAFHPNYAAPGNGFFYVHYTVDPTGDVIIARYQVSADPNVTNPASELILKTIPHQNADIHNGGMLAFGPDGHLYVAVGDGGGDAQSVKSLLGKILRLDVDGPPPYVPVDNPFGNEIWAFGLRNPFRFSFDRATGQLYAGDVGDAMREEVNVIVKGGNYGWPALEGTLCRGFGPTPCTAPGLIPPIAEYAHEEGHCSSITGGYVYRGSAGTLPLGTYVFGDFCTGEIFALRNGAIELLLDTGLLISSFGEDAAGELYVVGLLGTVHRLVSTEGAFPGGVFVAAGNLPGDGTVFAGPGPGGPPRTRIFRPDGGLEAVSPLAFGTRFTGGVHVALGDVNHDGIPDLVVGAGPGGGPHVRVFSGANPALELASFFAFDPGFTGGVFVAAGDVNDDGYADVLVGAGPGGGPHVRVFSGQAFPALVELASFFAFDPAFTGGVFVAAGDVNHDRSADVVVGAGPGGGPHVRAFTAQGAALPLSFMAY